jgi:predicted  nucleic acid-binding Zn-ribbon protein
MSETEEIPQPEPVEQVETPKVEEKVKKERSEAQKLVLEKARAKGLEVRLQKAKERKEAKENALKEVEEKYKKVEVEKFEPEPEVEPEVEPEPPVKVETKPEPAELPREKTPEPAEPTPVLPDYEWKDKRLTYRI